MPVVAYPIGMSELARDVSAEELQETVEVLSDPDAVYALMEARQAKASGKVVRGKEAVCSLLDEREKAHYFTAQGFG